MSSRSQEDPEILGGPSDQKVAPSGDRQRQLPLVVVDRVVDKRHQDGLADIKSERNGIPNNILELM